MRLGIEVDGQIISTVTSAAMANWFIDRLWKAGILGWIVHV